MPGCGSGVLVSSSSLLIRSHHGRCQAKIPLSALFKYAEPPLLNETCYLKIDGRIVYLWRAVDAEGEVLDLLVQTRRNKQAALKLMRKLLKKYGFVPDKLI